MERDYRYIRWAAVICVVFWISVVACGRIVLAETSPQGNTVSGGLKMGSITAANDTVYTSANYTQDISVADNITLWSNGKHYAGVVSAITATTITLAGNWTGLTDTEVAFEVSNRQLTVNDSNGNTVYYIDAGGDIYWLDDAGITSYFFDASAGSHALAGATGIVGNTAITGQLAVTDTTGVKPSPTSAWNDSTAYQGIDSSGNPFQNFISGGGTRTASLSSEFFRLPMYSALRDTTGFIGGETWYSAIADTTYIYQADHTIRSIP